MSLAATGPTVRARRQRRHTSPLRTTIGASLELLLGDIRAAFGSKGTTVRDMFGEEKIEIASAVLVKTLVALEGRSWAELGKARKPLTPNRLARMLKPLEGRHRAAEGRT